MPSSPAPRVPTSLADLRKGQRASVTALDETGVATPFAAGQLERRLIEMGLVEGAQLEVMHEGFPGHDPIAVRVDEHVLALRRNEARAVRIAPLA
ncbi:Ferrous iron transport protein A [Rhodovastum atsumiense]|uniref:Ferrous iron transport protein A n=1 Tax=Rhodovastum atsumiense TaxID=504468 RepID=A0A5M6IZM5_9PROT|nr:FeoA family protein [Rhodovastum atsumiense]KAA5613786.1 ferrous iron transport protein A [Rhodovastum atsumiense]CAH2601876.1 Ferrous iron transport protein A [Rhodovastum atsumiense]